MQCRNRGHSGWLLKMPLHGCLSGMRHWSIRKTEPLWKPLTLHAKCSLHQVMPQGGSQIVFCSTQTPREFWGMQGVCATETVPRSPGDSRGRGQRSVGDARPVHCWLLWARSVQRRSFDSITIHRACRAAQEKRGAEYGDPVEGYQAAVAGNNQGKLSQSLSQALSQAVHWWDKRVFALTLFLALPVASKCLPCSTIRSAC